MIYIIAIIPLDTITWSPFITILGKQHVKMVHLKSLVATAAALFTYAYATPTLPHDRRVMLPADRKVMLPPDRKVMLPADRKETVCSQHGKVIEGSYIVTLKPSFQSQDLDSHIQWVGSVSKQGVNKRQFKGVEKTFSSAYGFHGYAGSFDEDTLAEIRSHPDVRCPLPHFLPLA